MLLLTRQYSDRTTPNHQTDKFHQNHSLTTTETKTDKLIIADDIKDKFHQDLHSLTTTETKTDKLIIPDDIKDKFHQDLHSLTTTETKKDKLIIPDDIKDKFHQDLHSLTTTETKTDKLIILGGLYARVGTDHLTWDGVIGKNGLWRCNTNGHLLLQYCAEHGFLVTNSTSRFPARNRTSWMHPRSGHLHLLDFVIFRKRDRQDVRATKSMCGADRLTDDRLLISKMKIRILPKRRPLWKPAPSPP
ncbi:craniofacial development protein 2 [Elysia marginata]|uniref:Craniofacial development protein 2 n=1 Tax=Elysia marginata TaxID=1093978 RepID=A0AAV4IR10_9GAST|nr:craniofacial development protein 2 [Elysia marginata]